MGKIGIQAPWTTYYNKISSIFKDDEEINVLKEVETHNYGDEENNGSGIYVIKITSENVDKIFALKKIFIPQIPMGNIVLKIDFGVINKKKEFDPVGDHTGVATLEDYKTAFENNPIVKDFQHVEIPNGFVADYIIFSKDIIQFYNDDLSDYYGNFNGLVEDVVRDVTIQSAGIFYSTEKAVEEEA